MAPQTMRIVDLLDGREELLVLDHERYKAPAWIARDGAGSRLEALMLLTDGSFLLAEKNGSRFRFDGQGRLTDMVFSASHGVRFTYEGSRVTEMGDSAGGKVTFGYDRSGKIVGARAAGGAVHYRYSGDQLESVRTASTASVAERDRP